MSDTERTAAVDQNLCAARDLAHLHARYYRTLVADRVPRLLAAALTLVHVWPETSWVEIGDDE